MVWYGTVWYGMVWYGMVCYVMVWYGIVFSLSGEGLISHAVIGQFQVHK